MFIECLVVHKRIRIAFNFWFHYWHCQPLPNHSCSPEFPKVHAGPETAPMRSSINSTSAKGISDTYRTTPPHWWSNTACAYRSLVREHAQFPHSRNERWIPAAAGALKISSLRYSPAGSSADRQYIRHKRRRGHR